MIAFLLLLLTGFLFPQFPGFALLTGSAAFYAASYWKVTVGETFELVMFWGAVVGCGLAWFGYA